MDWKGSLALGILLVLSLESPLAVGVEVEDIDATTTYPAPEETTTFNAAFVKNLLDEGGEIVIEASDANLEQEEMEEDIVEADKAVVDDEVEVKSYEGVQVFRVAPTTDKEADNLQTLDGAAEVWPVVINNTTYMDILVEPDNQQKVKDNLEKMNLSYEVLVKNLQKDIENEKIRAEPNKEEESKFKTTCTGITGMNWYEYHSYDTISSYMDCLKQQYGHIIDLDVIGQSYEGRDLKVIRIRIGGRRRKESIWIDGGIHAREWISPATVTYILSELVEKSENYRGLLESYDIYIMPSMNPDGYEYTRNYVRLWRKTRSKNAGSSCVGVDPNRNWGYKWGGEGSSGQPCSEIYRGPSPFSESETRAVRDYILARKRNLRMYLTFHSYGQMILYPWGYARDDHEDENELYRVGAIGNHKLGNSYSVGSAAKVLYPAAGGSDDWAKGGADIKYSYTIELPDTGKHGFVLPPNQILRVAPLALEAVVAMAAALQ